MSLSCLVPALSYSHEKWIPTDAQASDCVMDDADLEEVYNTERHLLYVACTRARDRLWVSSVSPASEFVDDLG